VGRVAFKKVLTPWVVATPSHSPYALRPSTFRAPGWGAPALLLSCCCWRSATLRRLAPFSHCSASRIFIRQPSCIPSPMVTQEGDHRFDGGRSKPGFILCPPSASRIFIILAGEGGELSRSLPSRGLASPFFLRHLGWKPSSSSAEEASSSHAGGRRTAAARPWCNIPSSVRATVAGRTGGSHNTSYAARAVLVFWDGPVLVFVARTGVRTYRCALGRPTLAGQVDAAIGAEVVAAGEGFSADEIVGAICAPGLWLFGFIIWFSSSVRGREREPSSGSVRPGTIAAAAEVAGESPRVCRPAGPLMWGLFVPAGVEPEFRL
jgi:hypothetical protein